MNKQAYPCQMHAVVNRYHTYWSSEPYGDYDAAWQVAQAWEQLGREVMIRPSGELNDHAAFALDYYAEPSWQLVMYNPPDKRHFTLRKCAKCKNTFRLSGTERLCRHCGAQRGYSDKNWEERYSPFCGDTVTFGFELELQDDGNWTQENLYDRLREDLIKAGFLRTSDGTVTDEMKSPVYGSGFLPGNLRKLLERASVYTQAKNVGTHVHIGNLVRTDMYGCRYLPLGLLTERAETIFGPLERYLVHHQYSTVRIWGRWFGNYRTFPMTDTHPSWVALRDNTIEWRLPKLRDYQQFARLVKWLVACGKLLQVALCDVAPYSALDGIGEAILTSYITFFHLEHDTLWGDIEKALQFSDFSQHDGHVLTASLDGTPYDELYDSDSDEDCEDE